MPDFDSLLAEAAARPLAGWDVSYDGRITSVAPWDFAAIVAEQARQSPDMLDMGTGGGEWLSRLPYRAPRTIATEGWPPNVPIARERLQPLGIEVVPVIGAPDNVDQGEQTTGGELPFPDASFQLVVNRHESYLAREVGRILTPGGVFLTQQVASGVGDDLHQLLTSEALPVPARPWVLNFATAQLEAAGFVIEQSAMGDEIIAFADVGAVAWYLSELPWVLPGFVIQSSIEPLRRIHAQIQNEGPVKVRQPVFWLRARWR